VEVSQGEGAIDEEADDQAVDHRHDGCLGGRKPAGAHAAKDNDGSHERPKGLLEGIPDPRQRIVTLINPEIVAKAEKQGRDDERDAGQDPGDHAADKERRDGGGRDQDAVDDEGNGGWNEDIGGARGGGDRSSEGRRISGPHHRRKHDATDGRGTGRTGTGNAADHHGYQNGDDRERAPAAPDKG